MISLIENTDDCFHEFIFSNNFFVCNKCGLVLNDTNIELSERYNSEQLNQSNEMNLKSTKIGCKMNSDKYAFANKSILRLQYTESKFNNFDNHDKFMSLLRDNCTEQSYHNYLHHVKFLKYVDDKAKFVYKMLLYNENWSYKRFITLTDKYNIRFNKKLLYDIKKPTLSIEQQIFKHLQFMMTRFHFSVENPFEVVKAIKFSIKLIQKTQLSINIDMLIDTLLAKILQLTYYSQTAIAQIIGKERYEKASITNYFRYCNIISEKIELMKAKFKPCIIQ